MTLTNLEKLRMTIRDKLKIKPDETIGIGDGIRVKWVLEMQPIQTASAVITVNGVVKTLTTDYTLNLETGLLEFVSTDVPRTGEVVAATSYGYYAFSDDELNDILTDKSNIIPMAAARCLRILAADAAKFFAFWSGDEKIDQSKMASNLLKAAEALEQEAKRMPASDLQHWEVELEDFGDTSERDIDLTEYDK